MITLTTDQAQQIEEAFENAESVAASINAGKHHVIQIDDEKCFWQREEWVRWAIDEVLPEIREALSAIRAARAQDQAEQEPVAYVSEIHLSRYTLEWNGQPLPEGTELYAGPNYYLEQMAEEAECVKLSLDKAGVPTADESGKVYSLWGRVCRYAAPVERQWVDLTDDEIDAIPFNVHQTNGDLFFARAVIAKFKEKNK